MKTPTLGDLVETVSTWNPSQSPEAEFTYIDLGSLDKDSKQVTEPSLVRGAEAPSRARQLVATGDVLVSTVRPNLNAVAVVSSDLDGATASTGFTVLRPGPEIDSKFLFHWVRSRGFVDDMVRKATGASYPAISDRIVKGSLAPLLALSEQRRIAEILDNADSIRLKRRRVIAKLDALARSVFVDHFGKVQERTQLRNLGVDFISGKNVLGNDGASHPSNRVIKVSAVSSGDFDASETKPMPSDYMPPESHRLRPGDILFGRASGSLDLLGATALVDTEVDNLFLPDKVWRLSLRPDASVVEGYVLGLLRSEEVRAFIRHNASGAAGVKNIAKAKLLECEVPAPGRDAQLAFIEVAGRIAKHRSLAVQAKSADDELFTSLQVRAFRGGL